MRAATTDLDAVDLLEGEVRQSEDGVHAPQRELGDGVAVQVDGQVVQSPDAGHRVDLLQAPDVGRTEDQSLNKEIRSGQVRVFNVHIQSKLL